MTRLAHLLLLLAVLLLAPSPASANPKYISRLPNGAKVPGSKALGHVNVNGTGALNAFGRHFIFSAREWSVGLCKYDSDGDGQTNGQELGDPCCEWVPGDTPRFTEGVSHPGDKTQTANKSLWLNITCPNVTKLGLAARSSAVVRASMTTTSPGIIVGIVLSVLIQLA